MSGMCVSCSGAAPRSTLRSHRFALWLIGIWGETANMPRRRENTSKLLTGARLVTIKTLGGKIIQIRLE